MTDMQVLPATLERIVTKTAIHFLSVHGDEIDDAITTALADIGEFAAVDRSYVFQRTTPTTMTNTHEWCAPAIEPMIDHLVDVPVDVYPWFWSRIRRQEVVHVEDVAALPPEAAADRENLEAQGIRSVVAVPMVHDSEVVGFIGFDAVDTTKHWSDTDLGLLESVSDMFVHAIEHRRSSERMEQLVRSKDEFVASVSHELRTPLTAVVGLAGEMFEGLDRFDEGEVREFAGMIAEQSIEVARIVEDLLVVARADIGQVPIDIGPIDLGVELATVLRSLRPEGDQSISVPESARAVARGDAMRVRQILRNLLTNALRYGRRDVWAEMSADGDWATVRVFDDGPGVVPEERESIFSPYHRLGKAGALPASIGIGLTVARKLARLMGGDVTCLPGDVSCFELRLPAA